LVSSSQSTQRTGHDVGYLSDHDPIGCCFYANSYLTFWSSPARLRGSESKTALNPIVTDLGNLSLRSGSFLGLVDGGFPALCDEINLPIDTGQIAGKRIPSSHASHCSGWKVWPHIPPPWDHSPRVALISTNWSRLVQITFWLFRSETLSSLNSKPLSSSHDTSFVIAVGAEVRSSTVIPLAAASHCHPRRE
jgi:hypothetical protein